MHSQATLNHRNADKLSCYFPTKIVLSSHDMQRLYLLKKSQLTKKDSSKQSPQMLYLFRNLRKSNGLRNLTCTHSVGSTRVGRIWFLQKNTLPWINASYICKNMMFFIWLLVWNHHLEREIIQQVIKSQFISSREVNFWST